MTANTGKTILVTGAASGIGRAVTLALAKAGSRVLMLDKKTRHLEKLYDQIIEQPLLIEQPLREPVILPVDLENITPESATVLAQSIADEFTNLDGILHNAGELGSPSPMDQYDLKYWNQVMQVNLHAPYLLTRALLPLLKQDQQTNILFTSADVGRKPQAYWGAYAIAYSAVEAQMTLWAEELERTSNIKVNSIDPGAVRTQLRRRSHPGESQNSLVSPNEITALYLEILLADHNYHGQQLSAQKEAG